MSVVACRVVKNGYEISSDSIIVSGSTQDKGIRTSFVKLFEVNDLVIGGVGLAEELSLLFIFAATHKPSGSTEKEIIEFLGEFSDWKYKRTNNYQVTNSVILGFEGKVFIIGNWFVTQIKKYDAIGAGADFALAILHHGGTTEEAVNTAIELSTFCEGPVISIKRRK